jgi:DNA-binding IclR family transcriptional regulator
MPLPPDTEDKDPQFAYTLARGLEVLRAFEGSGAGLGNREIAAIIGIPRSTVARLTRTLGMLGYLHYDAPTTRYRLTAAMLTLAYPVLAQLPVRQVARPHMQALANYAQGSVSLAMRGGLQLVLVESCVDPKAVTRPDVGAVRDMADTALGMAYLAGLPEPDRKVLLAELLARVPKTPASARRLRKSVVEAELKRCASHGFCLAASGVGATLAVGVPVRLQAGLTMSLNCVVATHLATEKRMTQDIGPRLVKLARDLERLMGHKA